MAKKAARQGASGDNTLPSLATTKAPKHAPVAASKSITYFATSGLLLVPELSANGDVAATPSFAEDSDTDRAAGNGNLSADYWPHALRISLARAVILVRFGAGVLLPVSLCLPIR